MAAFRASRAQFLLWGTLTVACCLVPVLIAGGVAAGMLGTMGVWLSNPWLIGAAV